MMWTYQEEIVGNKKDEIEQVVMSAVNEPMDSDVKFELDEASLHDESSNSDYGF